MTVLQFQVFFEFLNNLATTKNFDIAGTFFQVLLSTIFYKKSCTSNEAFLTWSTLTCNIFSEKSWFLYSYKSQVQKSGDTITCFFCTVKKKKFRSSQAHSWNPIPLSSVISLLVIMVCVYFVYLHDFRQCYLCFTGRIMSECAVYLCVFVCVISTQSTSEKHIMCQTSVNLTPCCREHMSRSFWY